MTTALDLSVTGIAGADGIARSRIGPTVYGHEWHVSRLVTSTNDSTNRNELRIYLNGESPNRLIAGTYNANQDFNEDDFTLQTLDALIPVWSLCVPGTICVLTVQGTIRDKRAR